MQYVVQHCFAEKCKAFPKNYTIWTGAYSAIKPVYAFQHWFQDVDMASSLGTNASL